MLKTFTNKEIIDIVTILESDSSFTKNQEIKPDFEILWAVKKNATSLHSLFQLISETQNEIISKYLKPDYFEKQEAGSASAIKPEYRDKLIAANKEIENLFLQVNNLEISTFHSPVLEQFTKTNSGKISMPELSALEFFIEDSAEEKV